MPFHDVLRSLMALYDLQEFCSAFPTSRPHCQISRPTQRNTLQPMSLPTKRNSFFGAALLGACLAVVASIPASAFLAAAFGDTYNSRVLIYGGLLLWVVVGAISIFILTKDAEEKPMTIGQILLWFVSAWLWPLLVSAYLFGHKKT